MISDPPTSEISSLHIALPDDWHLHLRDGAALSAVLPHTAAQFGRAIVMPNLKPPVTTTELALAYRGRILHALDAHNIQRERVGLAPLAFEPLMTLYLTDQTSADEIRRARDSGFIHAVKLYPAGATTNSHAGVTDLRRPRAALEAMEKVGLPLCVHGEVVDPAVDLFDRERVFIDDKLIPLRREMPGLRIVFEHITTREAVQYVRDTAGDGGDLGATITAHHLLYNRNAIFSGGVRPHYYCLPVLKREVHRLALLDAATSGDPRFFLGTDSAPHAKGLKEHACGCAGCYTALHAMALYATAFEQAGRLDRLEGFARHFGADFYRLPRHTRSLTLVREPYGIPQSLAYGETELIPLDAGQTLAWTCAQ